MPPSKPHLYLSIQLIHLFLERLELFRLFEVPERELRVHHMVRFWHQWRMVQLVVIDVEALGIFFFWLFNCAFDYAGVLWLLSSWGQVHHEMLELNVLTLSLRSLLSVFCLIFIFLYLILICHDLLLRAFNWIGRHHDLGGTQRGLIKASIVKQVLLCLGLFPIVFTNTTVLAAVRQLTVGLVPTQRVSF